MRAFVSSGSTRQSRAWISRLRRPRQRPVDDRVLEDDAGDGAGGERLGHDVEPGQPSAAGGRPDGCGEHADRRRLAGSVGAEQAEDLSWGDLEVDRLYGLDAARVRLAECGDLDRWRVHSSLLSWGVPHSTIRSRLV